MSYRSGEDNLLKIIRDLQARVNKLESYGTNYRRNDIRIGDLLISWDGAANTMTLRNLATGGAAVTIAVP